MIVVTASENLEREATVIEMIHAVGKEAAPDSHPSILQMSNNCDICNDWTYKLHYAPLSEEQTFT